MTKDVNLQNTYKLLISGPGSFLISANTSLKYRVANEMPDDELRGHVWNFGTPPLIVTLKEGESIYALGKGVAQITVVEHPVQVSQTPEERATRDGMAFIASLPGVDVGKRKQLLLTFQVPHFYERRVILKRCIFSSSVKGGGVPLEYAAFIAPELFVEKPLNVPSFTWGAEPSGVVVRYGLIDAGKDVGGRQVSAGAIPSGGGSRDRVFESTMRPGDVFGFLISGMGRGAGVNAKVYTELEWYEQKLS